MNKTLYLFSLVLVLNLPLSAQTPIWQEDFTSPEGWTLQSNWSIEAMLKFDYSPIIFNFDLSAFSPVIYVDEHSEYLTIKQYLAVWQSMVTTEKAEISILTDEDEVVLWSYELADGFWGHPNGEDIVFPFDEFAGKNIRFRFRSFGPTTGAWLNWIVFNMEISATFENDLCVKSITGPNFRDINEAGAWSVEVINYGQQAQSNYVIELFDMKTDDIVASLTASNVLDPGESSTHALAWTPNEAYNTVLYARVIPIEDDYPANNSSGNHFLRIHPDIEYDLLVWDNDNGIPTILNPGTGNNQEPDEVITDLLDFAGFEYTKLWILPPSLNEFEIILATLGCYCVS